MCPATGREGADRFVVDSPRGRVLSARARGKDGDVSLVTPRLAGHLLVATPALGDPHFDRSVVLVLDHDDSGALGVVINRPTPVPVDEVLPDWSPYVTGEPVLFAGGPVGTDSALALAELEGGGGPEAPTPGFRPLAGALGLLDLDTPPEILAPGLIGLRVFAGYSGWSSGQLEAEIDADAWFVVPSRSGDPFSVDADRMWRSVLRRQPGELAWVSTAPADPSMN
jgi:putative transcriptional regulator